MVPEGGWNVFHEQAEEELSGQVYREPFSPASCDDSEVAALKAVRNFRECTYESGG